MKKKILFIISGLVLAGLIFYGGVYLGQETLPVTENNQSDFYHYFATTMIDGYGTVKDIDVNNSIITLSSQISENKTLKVNFNENSRFYLAFGWDENGNLRVKPIELKDLKINDNVYFSCQSNKDGSYTLLYLNVASKE